VIGAESIPRGHAFAGLDRRRPGWCNPASMKYRNLGRSGIPVSEIGFGAWGIGGGWGTRDDAAALQSLEAALDAGVTFFDTAMGYGDGHSEELVGKAVRSRRENVVIATKISPRTKRWPVLPRDPVSETFPGDWIVECTEASLRRLGVDRIDVQQLHAWTPGYLGQGDWLEALAKLKAQGKVRAFGISTNDWDPYGAVGLIESGLIDSVQVIYNIFDQRPQERLLPAAIEHGVGIIVRVPFEEGLLTGAFGPDHRFEEGDWRGQWLTPERLAEAAARVEKLGGFLTADRPTPAALALKFCLSHPAVSTVIPGMRSPKHVAANTAVSDGIPLTDAEVQALAAHRFVHGWAYPWAQK